MGYEIVKRGIDVAGSTMGLVLLSPLLLVLVIAIAAETPGLPVFVQQRVGRGGHVFFLYKLRSMVKDAPRLGSYQTQADDPRITRVGRFIRATSLDELPQLWNVLIGDMSLIGPRPETLSQQAQYRPEDWRLRHRVRPGITGLAQISGRSDITSEERLRCDLTYAQNASFALDMEILWRTVAMVFKRTGVN